MPFSQSTYFKYSKGSVLVLALTIIILLELVALAAVSSININNHVFSHYKHIRILNSDADNLINYVISNVDYFVHYSDYVNTEGDFEISIPDYVVTAPRTGRVTHLGCYNCQFTFPIRSSLGERVSINNTHWQLRIELNDPQIDAAVAVAVGLFLTESASETATNSVRIKGVWWHSQSVANRRESL